MAYSDEKTGGCSRSSRPLTYFIYDLPHDCSDRSGEEGGQRAAEVQDSISTTIYISGPTFVKLAHDLVKLNAYGFDQEALKLIHSYLYDRSQKVLKWVLHLARN